MSPTFYSLDQIADITVAAVEADTDDWTDVKFPSHAVQDPPADMEGWRYLINLFIGAINQRRPEWYIIVLENEFSLARSKEAITDSEAERWKWIQIRKEDMD